MNSAPTFSVVIPLFNKLPYIRRAVTSVLRQDFADFEVLVVDDGSTDGSTQAIADITDGRLRVIRQDNGGEGAARNKGIAHTSGAWVAFLDADDAWWPGHLAELQRVIAKFPTAGLVSAGCVEATGAELPDAPPGEAGGAVRKVDYFLEASHRIGFINATSVAIRRDVLSAVGTFSAFRAGCDLEYWARVALRHDVAVSSRTTCAYFRDTGGVMNQLGRVPAPRATTMPRIEELSPSVAMLCARGREDASLWANPSIRSYVNSRLESAIRASLYNGDCALARGYSALFLSPLNRRQRSYRVLAALPLFIQRSLIAAARQARGLLRGAATRGPA